MMLLHLAGDPDLDEDTLEEYAEWALDRDRLSFGTLANRRLGVLGRCADSLSAEICFLLAERIEDEETRRILTEHGKDIGQEALIFNTEQGLKAAEQQVKALLAQYSTLISELDRDSDEEGGSDSDLPPALPAQAPQSRIAPPAVKPEILENQEIRPTQQAPLEKVPNAVTNVDTDAELVGNEEESSEEQSSEEYDSSDFDSDEESSDESEES